MEPREQINNDEIVIDLREIWAVISRRLVIIIPVGIIFALAAMLLTKVFITPQYVSTTKMVVLNKQDSNTLTSADMQASTLLTRDYVQLIQNRNVTEGVIAQLGLNMSHEGLMSKLSVETPTDTRIVSISVRDPDPYMAAEIADAVRDTAAKHIQDVLAIEAVNVAERANIPTRPVSPNVLRNGMMGGVLGILLSLAYFVITYLMNDTIQTSEDIEKYLGISCLGSIPLYEDEKKSKKKRKKRKNKSGR